MVSMRMAGLFFDAPAVHRAMDKASRKALSRAGAFIRRTARTSIRSRKAISQPGRPPSSHAGHLRALLFFAYDIAAGSVVIGPARFKEGVAPNLLEFGGAVRTKKARLVGTKQDAGRNTRGQFQKRRLVRVAAGTQLKYKPRPFMGPAYEKELPNLPKRWKNTIRG